MNDTENLTTPASDIGNQIEALQRQVLLLLLGLVVLSATVVFYLFSETHFLGKDLDEIRPQAMKVIETYTNNKQAITGFHQALSNYAVLHPSFRPIVEKYGWKPPGSTVQP